MSSFTRKYFVIPLENRNDLLQTNDLCTVKMDKKEKQYYFEHNTTKKTQKNFDQYKSYPIFL